MIDRARVRAIFTAACAEPDAARRADLVALCCGDDLELRTEVLSLLEHDARPAIDLERGIQQAHAGVPDRIGPYRVIELLGEGGMGVVYLAEEATPHRIVAIKVMHRSRLTPARRARFEREIAALGRLRHPGIVPIYAAGTDADGQPYFAMEFVRGRPLLTWARETTASIRARVERLVLIADAVQHAHEHGVLHRDLKPANIMVDEHGHPRVLDFGVARVHEPGRVDQVTMTGAMLGTLAYMSPEQVAGRGDRQDPRTDLYALGVVAFELLAGRLPYDVGSASLPEAARIIREREPDALSSLVPRSGTDLDVIIGKALAKEPARRYHTAAALADDLRRWLDGRPILARPPSAAYQLRRFAARHRAVAVATGLALVTLLAAAVVSSIFGIRATRAQAAEARHAAAARWQAYVAGVAAIESALLVPDVVTARRRLEALPDAADRPFEAAHYAGQVDGSTQVLSVASPEPGRPHQPGRPGHDVVYSVAWSPDGRSFAAGTADGRVILRATAAGPGDGPAIEHRLDSSTGAAVLTLQYTPDGRALAAGTSGGTLLVWDVDSGRERWRMEETSWDAVCAARPHGETGIGGLTWYADGTLLAAGGGSGRIGILDGATGAVRTCIPIGPAVIWEIVVEDDSTVLASTGAGEVVVASVPESRVVTSFTAHAPGTTVLARSPDGRLIATGGRDGVVRLWDRATWSLARVLSGHRDRAASVAFTPDGTALLSTSSDMTARLWDVTHGSTIAILTGHTAATDCGAISPDGRRIATGSNDGSVRLWDVDALRAGATVVTHAAAVTALAESGTGLLLSADATGRVHLSDGIDGATIATLDLAPPIRAAAFSADATRLAIGAGAASGRLCLIDLRTGVRRDLPAGTDASLSRLCWQGEHLFGIDGDGMLHAWRADGTPRWSVPAHTGRGVALAASPDGRTLVTGGFDHLARLWSAADGTALATLSGHEWVVSAAAFLDDDTVVTAGYDGTVRRWSVGGRPLLPPTTHDHPVIDLALDRSRTRLAIAFNQPHLAIVDVVSGDLVATLRSLRTAPPRITWSDAGGRLLAVQGSEVAVWDDRGPGRRAADRPALARARAVGTEVAAAAIRATGGDHARAHAIVAGRADLDPQARRAALHHLLGRALAADAP